MGEISFQRNGKEFKLISISCFSQQFLPQFWGVAFLQIDDLIFDAPDPIPCAIVRTFDSETCEAAASSVAAYLYQCLTGKQAVVSMKNGMVGPICPNNPFTCTFWLEFTKEELSKGFTKEQFENEFTDKARSVCMEFATAQLADLLTNIADAERKNQTQGKISKAIAPFIWDDDLHAVTMSIYNRVKHFNGLEPGAIQRAAYGLIRLHELAATRKQALVEAFKPCKSKGK